MADPIEKRETPIRGTDHQAEAMALLGGHRPPAGTMEALAAAQVHATIALTEAQIETSRLLDAAARELNTANMFKLAETLAEDHPLRAAILDGLLNHVTKNGPLKTDVMLAVRIRDLGLHVKPGDDLVVSNVDGTKSINLLAVDPENDAWLLLSEDQNSVDPLVDTPRIQAMFGEEIRGLSITTPDFPGI